MVRVIFYGIIISERLIDIIFLQHDIPTFYLNILLLVKNK